MDWRQFFIKKTWWGKLIGAFFGFLIAGPAGALLGILVGNFFDRGLMEHFSKPFWYYQSEKNKQVQAVFFQAMFSILGHIAKSEGRVSEQSIQYANRVMEQMQLKKAQRQEAQDYFNQGKSLKFDLYQTLNALQKAIGNNSPLIRLFLETQYGAVKATGLTDKKLHIINKILACMRLAPLHKQHHFMDDFPWYTSTNSNYEQHHSTNQERQQHQQRPFRPTYTTPLEEAYNLLEIKSTASQQDIKRAYRRQISRNHPDKLIAKSASEQEIKQANEKTQRIRKAYEQICLSRGIKV